MARNLRFGIKMEADGTAQIINHFERISEVVQVTADEAVEASKALSFEGVSSKELERVAKTLAELRGNANTTEGDLIELQRSSQLTAAQFAALNEQLSAVERKNVANLAHLARTLGTNTDGARNFAKAVGLTSSEAVKAVNHFKVLEAAGLDQDAAFEALNQELGLTQKQYRLVAAEAERSAKRINNATPKKPSGGGGGGQTPSIPRVDPNDGGGAVGAIASLTSVANSINEIGAAGQALLASIGPVYDALIGSNERLNQQLVASATNVASVADVSLNGQAITDPTEQIVAVQGELKGSLKELEEATKDLAGVTDAEVQGVFQSLLQNTAALTGQSQQFTNAIESSTELTSGLVATMSTLGVPMDQAASEIKDLLNGSIGPDSIIAKSLGIDGPMVQGWRAQNVLVDELVGKFEVFKAGNSLAANSIAGVTSNIQSLLESITQQLGADLLQPLVNGLQGVATFLENNRDEFIVFGQDVFDYVGEVAERIQELTGELLGQFLSIMAPLRDGIISQLGTSLEYVDAWIDNAITQLYALGKSILSIAQVLMPLVAGAIQGVMAISNSVLEQIMAAMPMVTDAIEGLSASIGIVADALTPVTEIVGWLIVKVGELGGLIVDTVGATVGAAFNATEAVVGTINGSLGESRDAVATYERTLQQLTTESSKRQGDLTAALEARQAAEANGTKITAEQAKAEKSAKKTAEGLIAALEAQKKELDQAAIAGKANRAAIKEQTLALDAQISGLEESISALEDYGDNLELSTQQAKELGSATEQLAEDAASAAQKLKDSSATNEELENAAETLVDTTKQQLELGDLTAQEAIKNYQKIARNAKLSAEQQIDAEKEITALKEQELQSRLRDHELAQAEIENDIEAGRISELEGEEQLSQSKLNALDEELKARKEHLAELQRLGRGDGQEADEVLQNVRELEAEREKVQIETEKRITELKEQELQKRLEDYRLAQAEIQNDIDAERISEIDGEKQLSQSKLNALDEELEARKDRLKELRKLGRGDSDEADEVLQNVRELEAEREALEIASAKRIAKLRLQELEQELDKALALIEKNQIEQENALKQARLDGTAGSAEAQALQLKQARERIEEQLNAEKERIQEIQELEGLSTEDKEEMIRASELRTAELKAKLLDNELAAEQALRDQVKQNLATEATAAERGLKERLAQHQAIEDSLQRQRDLLQQQGELFAAMNALQQSATQGRITELERALGAAQDLEKFEEARKDTQAGVLKLALEQNQIAGGRERILQQLIDRELEGSERRLNLERELAQEQRQKAQTQLALERELAKVTGQQSGVIQAQITLTKEGSQQRFALERQLAQALAKEEKAALQTQIAEAQKQAQIAAAQEAQRIEELKALGLDRNASELEIIQAKQAEQNKAAELERQLLRQRLTAQQSELELNLQNQRIEAERLVLDQESAANAAQRALVEAQLAAAADPTNALLQEQIKLAQTNVAITAQHQEQAQQRLAQQAASAEQQRALLRLQQKQQLGEAERAEKLRGLDQARELAAAGVQNATQLAQQGNGQPEDFLLQNVATSPLDATIANLPELTLSLPELPSLQVDPSNPLNMNMEGLRGDVQNLAAVLLNQPPPQVNVQTNNPAAPRPRTPGGGEFAAAAISTAGI